MSKIVIIGNGIAGVSVAKELRKEGVNDDVLIISGESDHHYSRTALMYIYMGHLKYEHTKPYEDHFWRENKIELKRAWVDEIDGETQSILTDSGEKIEYSKLVLAVGSASNKFGWPGQDLPGVQGLYNLQDLAELEKSSKGAKRAVIVGGGLIGVEMAEMMLSRGIAVTFLVREEEFWNLVLPDGESRMISEHIREHHVDLRLEEEMDRIEAGPDGKAAKVFTKKGEEIECQIVGLTAGVGPNVARIKNTEGLDIERGIMIDHYFQTSLPNVWAVGDCAQFREPLPGRRPIEQVWYTGKMQGKFLASNMAGKKVVYSPGVWWNSAKFFDIEYQTYGDVLANLPEGQATFFWRSATKYQCIRLNFKDDEDKTIIGVNVFGVRHRHEVWEHWISNEVSVIEVLENLAVANFDPEFFKQSETEILEAWNKQFPSDQVKLKSKKGLFGSLMKKLSV